MDTLFVKPAPGMFVRLEDASRYVAEEGEALPHTSYYRRRLRDGDLVKATPPKAPKPRKES